MPQVIFNIWKQCDDIVHAIVKYKQSIMYWPTATAGDKNTHTHTTSK